MDEPDDKSTVRDSFPTQTAGVSGELIGEVIGKFKVIGKIGEGAMGVVYVAYDGELDRRIAIKLLRPELSVRPKVREHLLEWHGVYNVACMAHARSEVSDAIFYAQVACLDQRMLALETALSTLERPSPELVKRARRGLAELQPIEPCGRRDQLRAVTPLPTNPAVASEVATLRGWLTRDEALRRMEMKIPRARDFPNILARAQATGHTPLVATVLATMALEATPDSAESERLLLQAVFLAEAAGDDALVAEIGLPLVHVMGSRNLQFDEAGRWAAFVHAKLERTRAGGRAREQLEHNRGTIARRRGDEDGARGHFEAALQISRSEHPPDVHRIGVNLRYLAAIDSKLGDLDQAEANLAQAAAMLRTTIGEEHRQYGLIRLTRGHILLARRDYTAAKRVFAKLVDTWSASAGPGSSEVALALQNLASACILLGEHDEALGYLDRGESIVHDAKGDASPSKAGMLTLRAMIERDRDHPYTAGALLRQALGIYTFAYHGDHPDIARTLVLLGEVSLAGGGFAAADRYRAQAAAAMNSLPGPQPLLRLDLALLSAEVAIHQEDWHSALRWAQSASSQYDDQPTEPWRRARTLFALARAEAAAGATPGRLKQLGSAARAEIHPVDANQAALGRTITRWLAELPPHGPVRAWDRTSAE